MANFIVSFDHASTSWVIGKPCLKCKKLIAEGDKVVSRPHERIYHEKCWDGCFVGYACLTSFIFCEYLVRKYGNMPVPAYQKMPAVLR